MDDTFIFKNAFMIDGTGADPVPNAALVVSGGTIREIHRAGERGSLPSGRVIDLKGRTLMPGLIDAHVHPGNVEWRLPETVLLPPAVYVHRVTRTLKADLALGFTHSQGCGRPGPRLQGRNRSGAYCGA